MSLTVLYRGKKLRFAVRLGRRKLFSLAGLSVAALLIWQQPWVERGIWQSPLAAEKLQEKKLELAYQQEAVAQIRERTERELTALSMKMGELQAQVMRLEALGGQLAGTAAEMAPAELEGMTAWQDWSANSDQPMPLGGPVASQDEWPESADHELLQQLDAMLDQLKSRQQELQQLESVMHDTHVDQEVYLAGRPVTSPGSWQSSGFGVRKDPFSGNPTMHRGLDFAGHKGSPVWVTGAGIVSYADRRGGYGKLVEVDHGNGIRTRYAHLDSIHVEVGDVVTRGEQIGELGSTGRSTGPHVHYEVLEKGEQINPLRFVQRQAPNE